MSINPTIQPTHPTLRRKVISSSEPAFKPRKVKKASETYRDRAEERRSGKEGDYAQIEAILEEFEKRNAENEDRAAVCTPFLFFLPSHRH
jgi:RED-like protein N-terminal region